MSAKVSNSSCGRMRFNRSIAASMGSDLLGCRLVIDTGDDSAIGVQRPFSITNTVWTTVHLEAQVTAVLERVQRQLHPRENFSRAR